MAYTGDNGVDDIVNGGFAADELYGLSGDDTLNGGNNNDTLYGGSGNDTYIIEGEGTDIIREFGQEPPNAPSDDGLNGGTDTVESSIDFSLNNASLVLGDVENLTLTGIAINGTGNELITKLSVMTRATTLVV